MKLLRTVAVARFCSAEPAPTPQTRQGLAVGNVKASRFDMPTTRTAHKRPAGHADLTNDFACAALGCDS